MSKSLTCVGSSVTVKKSINHVWNLMRKSFLQHLAKGTNFMEILRSRDTEHNKGLKAFLVHKSNPIDHWQLNWLKVKLRSNKDLLLKVQKKIKDSLHNYETIKTSKELNDTSRWKHKWSLDFNKLKANVEFKEEEQYIECVEVLKKEANELMIGDKLIVVELSRKIKKICCEPVIKHTTIYRGKNKVLQLVLSLPAFEVCTESMQTAIQFVLVDVLQGDADMLILMMSQRGLPIHPAILESAPRRSDPFSGVGQKCKIANYVDINKKLASLPPDHPSSSRELISRLQKGVIYSNY